VPVAGEKRPGRQLAQVADIASELCPALQLEQLVRPTAGA
jgi:hypothetical protein